VVDTGVNTDHPDLTGRVVQSINFVEGGDKTVTADHHGTTVAGVIGARADNGIVSVKSQQWASELIGEDGSRKTIEQFRFPTRADHLNQVG
jgi:subtilisin family serine protease